MRRRPRHPDSDRTAPPRAAGFPVVGVLPRLRRDPLAVLGDLAGRGDVVYLGRAPLRPVYLVQKPGLVCEVLRDRAGDFQMNRDNAVLKVLLRSSIFMLEGDAGARRRPPT